MGLYSNTYLTAARAIGATDSKNFATEGTSKEMSPPAAPVSRIGNISNLSIRLTAISSAANQLAAMPPATNAMRESTKAGVFGIPVEPLYATATTITDIHTNSVKRNAATGRDTNTTIVRDKRDESRTFI